MKCSPTCSAARSARFVAKLEAIRRRRSLARASALHPRLCGTPMRLVDHDVVRGRARRSSSRDDHGARGAARESPADDGAGALPRCPGRCRAPRPSASCSCSDPRRRVGVHDLHLHGSQICSASDVNRGRAWPLACSTSAPASRTSPGSHRHRSRRAHRAERAPSTLPMIDDHLDASRCPHPKRALVRSIVIVAPERHRAKESRENPVAVARPAPTGTP